MSYTFTHFEKEAKKTKEWLLRELAGLRAGPASPQLVENIKADYYGQSTPLKHIAAITVRDSKTLVIQPWDKNALSSIEKAILVSDIGIQPIADKDSIRLSLPELTGERRAQLIKIVKEKLEDARIALRNIRQDAWNDIHEQEGKKEISEDEKFRLKDELKKKVDKETEDIEEIAEKKVQEIEA